MSLTISHQSSTVPGFYRIAERWERNPVRRDCVNAGWLPAGTENVAEQIEGLQAVLKTT